jgi:excisionase family DNA binding protein
VAVAVTIAELQEHDGLLSVTEVAAIIGLDPETIRRAIRRGELPASKPAGRIRIDPQAVLAWLQETSVSPRPPAATRAPARAASHASSGGSAKSGRRAAPGERGSFRERVRRSRES